MRWLERYSFPVEQSFERADVAALCTGRLGGGPRPARTRRTRVHGPQRARVLRVPQCPPVSRGRGGLRAVRAGQAQRAGAARGDPAVRADVLAAAAQGAGRPGPQARRPRAVAHRRVSGRGGLRGDAAPRKTRHGAVRGGGAAHGQELHGARRAPGGAGAGGHAPHGDVHRVLSAVEFLLCQWPVGCEEGAGQGRGRRAGHRHRRRVLAEHAARDSDVRVDRQGVGDARRHVRRTEF
ncbi:hypothetical protein ON010_g19172 [Phytophthora cinnamomi]|nr:hypothetical protein ON010_g19172 [Phytophthora cinnamomi]